MAHLGKVQLLITFVAPPAKVQEVDKLVASHAAWMRETHTRDGANALLSYNFAKGPGALQRARPVVGADRQHALRPDRDLRVEDRHPGALGAVAEVLERLCGDGPGDQQLQPADVALRHDRPVALVGRHN